MTAAPQDSPGETEKQEQGDSGAGGKKEEAGEEEAEEQEAGGKKEKKDDDSEEEEARIPDQVPSIDLHLCVPVCAHVSLSDSFPHPVGVYADSRCRDSQHVRIAEKLLRLSVGVACSLPIRVASAV